MKVRALRHSSVLLFVLFLHIVSIQGQPSQQVLAHHVPAAVTSGQAKLLGQLPATQRMNLSIVLPLRNQSELASLLKRLYDPSSPDFRHFLRVQEFTDQFGPTADDYQKVLEFAIANGFEVHGTAANRLTVSLYGSVSQVEQAFQVKMQRYQHPTQNREFISPDREPSLALGVSIAHIEGLNNISIPQPMLRGNDSLNSGVAAVQGSGPGGSYLGVDMRGAYYGGTALTGSGQAVGLLQFDGYDMSDVALTFVNSGQTNSVPINNVLLDGATGVACQFNPMPCEDAEQVLDIVEAAEMAPGLDQIRVYIGNIDTDILNAMASENLAKQLSVSWTWTPDDPATDDEFFQEFAAQGQSIFVASGDDGAFSPNISDFFYPAEDDYVTAVGGTSLITTGPAGQWVSETAWDRSGGGISPDGMPIPSWQAGVAESSNAGSTSLRNVPDVAMEADTDNYVCNMGACQNTWGGTSFAAPRWAGFAALVNQQAAQFGDGAIGFLNPALYGIGASSAYASTFHDITAGQNDNGGAYPPPQQIFQAVEGYDLVTGWGTPDGQAFIDALAPKTSNGFQLFSSNAQLSIGPGNSGSATITISPNAGFSGTVNLGIKGLPDGVTATWSEDPATTSSQLTLQVANSALHGDYLLTVTGTAGPASASTNIALVVNAPGFVIQPSVGALSVRPGLSSGTEVSVTRFAGFMGSVNFAVTSPLPSGVTAVWSANPADDQALLTFSATSAAPLTTTILTITGTSGNLTAAATVSLNVGSPGFWLSLAPPPSVLTPGGQVTSVVTLVPIGNFNEPASLSASQLPSGVTASFSPATISPGQSSVMTLSASSAAVAGSYTGQATATAADSSGIYSFSFVVAANPSPSFAFVFSPAMVSIAQGQSSVVTGSLSSLNGYAGTVSMFGVTELPSGMTFSYSPSTVSAGGTTQLTLTAGADTLPGMYAVGVGGEDEGGLGANGTTLYIFITPASSLGISLSPSSVALPQGQSLTSTATVTSPTGSVGNVSFAMADELPQGLSASWSAGLIAGTGVVTLTASNSLAPGTYTFNIAATSGEEIVDAPMTVTVIAALSTYTMSATPVSVSPGSSASSSITLSSNNGYTGTIALACAVTASPAGAIDLPTCDAGPPVSLTTSTNSANSMVTVSTSALTTPGTYTITVSATGSDAQHVVGSATFTLTVQPPLAATPTFGTPPGTYTSEQTVALSDSTPGAAIFYTTDGSTPTTSSTPYSGAITVSASETLQAIATATGYLQSPVASAAYTINLPAAVPIFSVAPGTYTSAQTVAVSDATPGAAIFYTTNGSTPTTSSTPYSGPIMVNASETIEAIATASGYSESPVASAAYAINLPNPAPAIASLSPAYTVFAGPAFTLTVNGSGYVNGSVVHWGNAALATQFVSSTQLTAQVPASAIASAGTTSITVETPAPGGGTSAAFQFEVDSASSSAAPTFTGTTASVSAGNTASYPVTLSSSVSGVTVSCLNLPAGASCSYSSTSGTVSIATSSTTPSGTYQITAVFNETQSIAAGYVLVPFLLLPLMFIRRKLFAKGAWIAACMLIVVMLGAMAATGCSAGTAGSQPGQTGPTTEQVTSSGVVTLTVK